MDSTNVQDQRDQGAHAAPEMYESDLDEDVNLLRFPSSDLDEPQQDIETSTLSTKTQCGEPFSNKVDSTVQTNGYSKRGLNCLEKGDSFFVAMKLKLAMTNIFMLKKHFDTELSKLISSAVEAKFHRIPKLGNFLFLKGKILDVLVAQSFCARRYEGCIMSCYDLPSALLLDETVTWMNIESTKNKETDDYEGFLR
ncbi:hypothetical protein HOLleu_18812 [Holothuria leucospilota]|uniref:Uncharacterized protein n=1 Tax=Holothuria leucospilota TaxID=206669 RepID=A0A9Q1C4E3_HOLLE|nr:hypothetical protein HOLleu_18812 [Holothuria leucospilota]